MRLLATISFLVGLVLIVIPRVASAHPLGNFTINRYARVEPGKDAVRVVYALDMAEIPTFQEMATLDRDKDGAVSEEEKQAYLDRRLPEVARNLKLTVNGQALALTAESGVVTLTEGQGGLSILRIDAVFSAGLPAGLDGATVAAQFRDTNYDNRLGWKEIVVRGSAGAAVRDSSVRADDVSNELRSYPDDALQSPLEVREASFSFQPGVPASADAGGAVNRTAARVAQRTSRAAGSGYLSRFADSAARKDLTLGVMLASLLAAVFWGALHALGPGHGKTVVAAYLVGSRGTARHAVFLGLTVTATHTAGVYLLGVITLTASHFIVPERLYPVLSLASGLVVVGMGVSLLWSRLGVRGWAGSMWKRRRTRHEFTSVLRAPSLALAATGAGPGVRASDAHDHAHDAAEHHAHDHGHEELGFHHHDDHDVGGHQRHDHSHGHDHGHGHSHAIPGMDGTPVTWRSLLALGIYGGLIPCPTAIVVLLTSISLDRVGFGMLLVVAFSAGLAAVLTGIGLALVYAGRALSRFSVPALVARGVPIASAAAVVVVGLLITLRAAGQSGLPLV